MARTLSPNDPEAKALLLGGLRRDKIALPYVAQTRLLADIDMSVSAFLAERSGAATYRESHDALRHLWRYAQRTDCDAERLKIWIAHLPEPARAFVDRRAKRVIIKLFPGARAPDGFLAWTRSATSTQVVRAVRVLAADGAEPTPGRRRSTAKTSKPRLEPLIFNTVRGGSGSKRLGGRHRHAAQDGLVANLAIDWLKAVGDVPTGGRSDRTGFGDLVHAVFELIGEPDATQALRRHFGRRATKTN